MDGIIVAFRFRPVINRRILINRISVAYKQETAANDERFYVSGDKRPAIERQQACIAGECATRTEYKRSNARRHQHRAVKDTPYFMACDVVAAAMCVIAFRNRYSIIVQYIFSQCILPTDKTDLYAHIDILAFPFFNHRRPIL